MTIKHKTYLTVGLLSFLSQAHMANSTVPQISALETHMILKESTDQERKSLFYVERGDLKIRLQGMVKLDAYFDFDGKQPVNPNGLDVTAIPLKGIDFNAKRKENFNYFAGGSRIELDVHQTFSDIPTHGFISLDFAGKASTTSNSYTPRIRECYAEAGGFLIGQTYYTFQDFDAFIPTLDNVYGPARQAMVRYVFHFSPGWSLAVAAERPDTTYYQHATNASNKDNNGYLDNDSSASNSQSSIPDGAFKLIYKTKKGHVAFRGIARELIVKTEKGENDALSNTKRKRLGWGLGLSTAIQLWPCLKLQLQVNGGKGIGHYLDDIDNANPFAAYFQYPAGLPIIPAHFQPLKMYQFIGGIIITWTDKLESAAAASYTQIHAPQHVPKSVAIPRFNRILQRYVGNLIYKILPNSDLGIEVLHYRRKAGVHTTHNGKDTRILTSFIYRF